MPSIQTLQEAERRQFARNRNQHARGEDLYCTSGYSSGGRFIIAALIVAKIGDDLRTMMKYRTLKHRGISPLEQYSPAILQSLSMLMCSAGE